MVCFLCDSRKIVLQNTKIIYHNINSWLIFGVGPDCRENLNVKGCLPTMIHEMETRTKVLV